MQRTIRLNNYAISSKTQNNLQLKKHIKSILDNQYAFFLLKVLNIVQN